MYRAHCGAVVSWYQGYPGASVGQITESPGNVLADRADLTSQIGRCAYCQLMVLGFLTDTLCAYKYGCALQPVAESDTSLWQVLYPLRVIAEMRRG